MKKVFIAAFVSLLAASCTTKEVRYIESTNPPTTAPKTTTTTARPTTTVNYMSDADWFIEAIYEVMDGRVYASDNELLETGFLVCQAFDSGISADEVMIAMFESAPYGGSAQDLLVAVTVGATTFLCPEWSWVWG